MRIQFRAENFLSIKDSVVLSLFPARITSIQNI